MEGGHQPGLPIDIAQRDGAPEAKGFDLDAHPGQVAEILGRDRRRAKTALGLRHHQPLGGQARERLADRAEADGEPGAELLNLETASRKDAAGQEIRAQILIGTLGEIEGVVPRHPLSEDSRSGSWRTQYIIYGTGYSCNKIYFILTYISMSHKLQAPRRANQGDIRALCSLSIGQGSRTGRCPGRWQVPRSGGIRCGFPRHPAATGRRRG